MTTGRKDLLLAVILGSFLTVSAQSYYDDDIYYDASKAPKVEKKVQVNRGVKQAQAYQVIPGSDSYTVFTNNTRDVDEYNRRGSYTAVESSSAADSLALNDFKYTRKIEKFYNPEVVIGSGDEDLIYYYSNSDNQSAPTQVNIYIDSPDYWNPYFYSSAWSWAWNRPSYMNPWYYNNPWLWDAWAWGPSYRWNWNWGWGPSWTWGPSWGWSWGWGPGYGPALGWYNPGWHRPGNPAGPGASRPVRNPNNRFSQPGNPVRTGRSGGVGSFRNQGGMTASRPGRTPSSSVGSSRPANGSVSGSTVGRGGSGTVARPYNPTNADRPTGTYTPSQNRGNTGGRVSRYSSGSQSSVGQYNNSNSNSYQQQNNTYRRSSSSSSHGSYRSSGSSYGGGRSSGGSGFSGGRSGGGASGRH